MIIIAGHLVISADARDAYVVSCIPVVEAAREAAGCLDFSITAETVDTTRVRIYKRWHNEEQLLAFRGSGPNEGQQAAIVDADVKRYVISSVGEP